MKKATSILLILLIILSSCNKTEEFRVMDGITFDEQQYDIVTKDYCYVKTENKPGVRGPGVPLSQDNVQYLVEKYQVKDENLKIEKEIEFYGVIDCETKRFIKLLQYEPNGEVRDFDLRNK